MCRRWFDHMFCHDQIPSSETRRDLLILLAIVAFVIGYIAFRLAELKSS